MRSMTGTRGYYRLNDVLQFHLRQAAQSGACWHYARKTSPVLVNIPAAPLLCGNFRDR